MASVSMPPRTRKQPPTARPDTPPDESEWRVKRSRRSVRLSTRVPTPLSESTPARAPARDHRPSAKTARVRTDKERRTWLDSDPKPFTAHVKRIPSEHRDDGFKWTDEHGFVDKKLAVRYRITPQEDWDALHDRESFTVGHETIGAGDSILVHNESEQDPAPKPSATNTLPEPSQSPFISYPRQWKATVLAIRSLDDEGDASHTFLLIAWLNRPSDFPPRDRRPHHGDRELVPTNDLDVISALSVNGRFELLRWGAGDGMRAPRLGPGQYYWRQSYDAAAERPVFSEIPTVCVEGEPPNPDAGRLVRCGRRDGEGACGRWMHVDCLAREAAERAAGGGIVLSRKRKGAGRRGAGGAEPARRRRGGAIHKGFFAVVYELVSSAVRPGAGVEAGAEDGENGGSDHSTIEVGGAMGGADEDDDDDDAVSLAGDGDNAPQLEVVLFDAGGNQASCPVNCLFCGALIGAGGNDDAQAQAGAD